MAEKRPICLYNGQLQELASADSLPSGGSILTEDSTYRTIIGGTNTAVSLTTASDDLVVIGTNTLSGNITTINDSVLMGNDIMKEVDSGTPIGIVGIGFDVFGANVTTSTSPGNYSIGLGYQAGKNAKQTYSFFAGYRAGTCSSSGSTGANIIAIGDRALTSMSGAVNNTIAIGANAWKLLYGTSTNNVAIGNNAAQTAGGTSDRNVVLGADTAQHMQLGSGNLFLGYGAGPTVNAVINNEFWLNNAESDTPLIRGYFDAHASGPLLEFAGDVTITNTGPNLTLLETDAAVDEGHYDFFVSGGVLRLRAINDAVSIANDVFTVARTGAVVDELDVAPNVATRAAVPVNADHLTRKDYVDGNFVSLAGDTMTGALFINHTAPAYNWIENGHTVDNKNWDMVCDAGVMYLRAINDAYTVAGNALTITRSGTSITSVGIGGDIDTASGKVIDMGTWTSTTDHIQLYGNGQAYGYGIGVESGCTYYRANITHRFYINSNANGGTSGVAMNLSSTECDVKSTNLKASGNLQTLGILTVDNATPQFKLYESDAATDEKYWRLYSTAGTLYCDLHNDANTVSDLVWSATRTGAVVDAMNVKVPLDVVGAGTFSGGIDKLTSATTAVSVAAATAPTSGQVLTATSSTAATWQNPSGGGTYKGCLAYVGTDLTSFTSGTVNMSSESYDTDGFHSTVTNTSRLTIPAGVSKVQISASIRTASAHEGQLYIMKNGVAHSWAGVPSAAESDNGAGQHDAMNIISGVVPVVQNDYFEMYVVFVSAETIEATNSWICIEVKE